MFSVLVRPLGKEEESAVTQLLDALGVPVTNTWYNAKTLATRGKHMTLNCKHESHMVSQLSQWAQCMDSIEKYEKTVRIHFDAVVKVRPDDLFYGPMLPFCAFNFQQVYISKQSKARPGDHFGA